MFDDALNAYLHYDPDLSTYLSGIPGNKATNYSSFVDGYMARYNRSVWSSDVARVEFQHADKVQDDRQATAAMWKASAAKFNQDAFSVSVSTWFNIKGYSFTYRCSLGAYDNVKGRFLVIPYAPNSDMSNTPCFNQDYDGQFLITNESATDMAPRPELSYAMFPKSINVKIDNPQVLYYATVNEDGAKSALSGMANCNVKGRMVPVSATMRITGVDAPRNFNGIYYPTVRATIVSGRIGYECGGGIISIQDIQVTN